MRRDGNFEEDGVIKKSLIAVCILLALTYSGHAEENPLSVELIGNTSARIAPGESFHIKVMVSADRDGTLELFLRGDVSLIESASDFEESIIYEADTPIEKILTIRAEPQNCGAHATTVLAKFTDAAGQTSQLTRDFSVQVVPGILPEPPFSPDGFNRVCWIPCDEHTHELRVEPPTGPLTTLAKNPLRQQDEDCEVVENLQNGVTYYYWVEANIGGEIISSDTVWSTQDNSPPPAVQIHDFSVAPDGQVTLRWPSLNDEIGFVDRYEIERRQLGANDGPFSTIDTLRFFPAYDIAPANYFPVKAESGIALYVDSPITIDGLPSELEGSAMIRTANADRWNGQSQFLSFKLDVTSEIYVAFDKNIRPKPDWLQNATSLEQELTTSVDNYKVFKLDGPLPPGEIVLGGNLSEEAMIRRKEPRMYVVFVRPVEETLPFATEGLLSFTDATTIGMDGAVLQYKITTVDAAQNQADGEPSAPIKLDLSQRCRPKPDVWYVFERADGLQFGKDASNTVCVLKPELDDSCNGFIDIDSLRFQAARRNPNFFGDHREEDIDLRFFDSGWKVLSDLASSPNGDSLCFEFEFNSPNGDQEFINGEEYFYRIQGKDVHDNLTAWSDTVSAIQDAAPPGDIRNLTAENRLFDGGEDGCVDLIWEAAADSASGIMTYIVSRNGQIIAEIPGEQTTFCDTLSKIAESKVFEYRIGSKDNVGHIREPEASSLSVSLRAAVGPAITIEADSVIEVNGTRFVKQDSVDVCWRDFDGSGVLNYEIEIAGPDDSDTLSVDPPAVCLRVHLQRDGLFSIRVRAVLSQDSRPTIWSNTESIFRKITPPAAVSEFVVSNDPDSIGSDLPPWEGNIYLKWQPGSSDAFEYEIRRDGALLATTEDTELIDFFADAGDDTLVTFRHYAYTVTVLDAIGMRSVPSETLSEFCNRAPTLTGIDCSIDSSRLFVTWQPPQTSDVGLDSLHYNLCLFQDGMPLDTSLIEIDTSDILDVACGHDYCVLIEAVEQRTGLVTAKSDTLCKFLHCDTHIPPVESSDIDLVVQPVDAGIFVTWAKYWEKPVWADIPRSLENQFPRSDVDHFTVRRLRNSRPDTTFSIEFSDAPDAVFNLAAFIDTANLMADSSYSYEIVACETPDDDRRCPPGAISEEVVYDTGRVFIPQIDSSAYAKFKFFRSDSLEVRWHWLERSNQIADPSDLREAASVTIQIANNQGFVQDTVKGQRVSEVTLPLDADNPEVDENRSFTFKNLKDRINVVHGDTAWIRIKGFDRYGHAPEYPFSDAFDEVFVVRDDQPPTVTDLSTRNLASATNQTNLVDVRLEWERPIDTVSGLDRYFVFLDSLVAPNNYGPFREATFEAPLTSAALDTHIFTFLPANRPDGFYRFRLEYEDCVGNRQNNIDTLFYRFRQGPDSITVVNLFCTDSSDTTSLVTWPAVLAATHYQVEFIDDFDALGQPGNNRRTFTEPEFVFHNIIDGGGTEKVWYFHVKAIFADGDESAWSAPDSNACETTEGDPATDVVSDAIPPGQFYLSQNYPNPFNPATTVEFQLPISAQVVVTVHDLLGRRVKTLVDQEKGPGGYRVTWDGSDNAGRQVTTGVYFIKMRTKQFKAVRKILLIK